MHKAAIFPSFYLPPIEFFDTLLKAEVPVLFDAFEHFPKQTYRNRTSIHSANGKLDLIVPVIKGSKVHTPMKDVKISYEFDWQRLHWLSLQTAYRSSAYFEFYEADFAPFYHQKWEYLFDYNQELFALICRLLKVQPETGKTEQYERGPEILDYRNQIHPKKSSGYQPKPYFQVFEDRNGFIPNLSIIDLLCSQGPQSGRYL